MNWRNVKLIFEREARDQLRDRRTLFMVFALPLMLYPLMGIGTTLMISSFHEQTWSVMLLNAADLPPSSLIQNGTFAADYFENPGDAAKLRVITDDDSSTTPMSAAERSFAAEVEKRIPRLDEVARVTAELKDAEERKDAVKAAELSAKL